jgi:hypothetical protein
MAVFIDRQNDPLLTAPGFGGNGKVSPHWVKTP